MRPTFKKGEDGNWTLSANNFALGSDTDHIEHMVKDNDWTASDAIDQIMAMANEALADANVFTVKSLFELLFSQGFSDWYEGDFMDFVEGEEGCKTKEQIIEDLVNFLRR